MKILFTGLPYFGKQLVRELNAFDPANRYVFCDTYYSLKDRLRFMLHLPTAGKVVSFNGVTSESGSLNWVLWFKKKLVMQWHGSDVLTAMANRENGRFTMKYINNAVSFTDAPWLRNELAGLGINAAELQFKHVEATDQHSPFRSAGVLTYIAAGREEFYGMDHVLNLADQFPSTEFHVVGTKGSAESTRPNITFYGWVPEEKMKELLDRNAVFMRLTRHDGYSLSVLQAIANGNYVLWNYPHPLVDYIDDMSVPGQRFGEVLARVEKMKLERNSHGISWARENLRREGILRQYIEKILQA